jgi:amino acid adenylation domain-containing protein
MQKEQIEGFRLSPQQKHIWLLEQSSNTSPYRVQSAVLIVGKLKIDVLKTALQKVINQHEILRTTFYCLPGMTIPLQVIADTNEASITEFDFHTLTWQEQETRIDLLFAQLKKIPFQLENSPPLQTYIITLSPEKYILILNLSALIADNCTLKHLSNKISSSYSACLQGQDLGDEPMQYADIAEWQNELTQSKLGKEYWRKQDVSLIDNFNFWFEKKQLKTSEFQPQYISSTIHNDLLKQIETLSQKYNVNKSNFLLVSWLILLWRITRQSDISIGIAGDGRKYEELDQALGLLSKYLPISYHLQSELKFSEILKQVNELANNVYEWQEYFTWEETGKSESFCPVGFEFEEYPQTYSATDLSFSLYKHYSCIDKFKIKLTCLHKSDALITEFHFDSELYNLQDIKTLSQQFQILLEDAINHPEASIGQLNILSDSELQKLLFDNNTSIDYPQDKCIHHLFEEQVERTPNRIAVVFEQQQLTYAQLNAQANQLAHHLRQQGVNSEVVVGLYVERSLSLVIGLLAILKAGGAYIPLDTAYPKERLALMLADTTPILLTQQQLVNNLPEHTAQVICLDAEDVIGRHSQENPDSSATPENLAYVLFTSGSTGKPKGVAVEHRQLCNYLKAIAQTIDLSVCTSFAHISTFAADLGNTTIFPSLCQGGCLHIISQERISNPEALADYFTRHPIDCLKIVPSHLGALLTASRPEQILPRLRLILGGETCSWKLIEQIQLTTECQIFNHYGPTETTVGVLTYAIEPGQTKLNDTVPIGRPIPNTQIYLLDSYLQPVPVGVPGELYIGGAGVARGYFNQIDLTSEKFISNPFTKTGRLYKTGDLARYLPDGNIEFLGRIDQQVKIRGFRIELGEIEIALQQHSAVRETVVMAHTEQTGNKRLVAYVVPEKQSAPSNSELREFLQQKLPKYMVPSVFVHLKAWPLLPNGKIDRQALPIPELSKPELAETFVAARTQVEETLVGIWAEILELPQVGIYDNFFEVGGDSILSIRIVAKANQAGLQLTPKQMFEHQTIAELAAVVEVQEEAVTAQIPQMPVQNQSTIAGSYTSDDFPQANLSQKDLDIFLAKLNQKK